MELLFVETPIWRDDRGYIKQPWNELEYNRQAIAAGRPSIEWAQDNISVSRKDVLRGIHGYHDLWRLCACVFGTIYFVVVDCRNGPECGKWDSVNLSASSPAILVPPGFGMASLTLTDWSVFYYKWSGTYEDHEQFSYGWDDLRFGIKWPIDGEPILSERDWGS